MTISERIAKEQLRLESTQRKIDDAKKAEKAQRRKLNKLKRDERTHHLCVRGGALNSLLQRPDELDDEQVIAFLQDVFNLPSVQKRLQALLPENPVKEVLSDSAEETLSENVTGDSISKQVITDEGNENNGG